MKIAVTGKGGVGKSTLAAAIAILASREGRKVLAVDADPDANLASALGMTASDQKKIITISRQKALIEERTGAKINEYGQMFKINPEVSDIADTYACHIKGVDLLVLGAVEGGGSGCACPENTLLRALVQNIVLHRDDTVIMDMEAGIEHLGRATTRGVDMLIVVVEPGARSIQTLARIAQMARDIGIRNVGIVANKIREASELEFIHEECKGHEILGLVPYSGHILGNDRDGRSVLDDVDAALLEKFSGVYSAVKKKVIDR